MGTGLNPDGSPEKGDKYAQIAPEFLEPGKTEVENIPGNDLDESDESQRQNGPDQCKVFHPVNEFENLLQSELQNNGVKSFFQLSTPGFNLNLGRRDSIVGHFS
jgi:hypothetical protein